MGALNKVCEALNKVCNVQQSNCDLHVPALLWAYRATCKKLKGQMFSRLVYEANARIPMKYIMPSLRIVAPMDMTDYEALREGIV